MASLYNLKNSFQNLLRPHCNACAKAGITPNQITILTIIISVAMGLVLVFNPNKNWALMLLPCILFLRMALNAIDGLLAREHSMESKLGQVLNELGDAVSDIALYLPLALHTETNVWLVITFVLLALLTEMTSVSSTLIGASRRNDGPMGKSDRAFWIGLMALLLAADIALDAWVNYYLILLIALLILTIFNRASKALNEFSN